jgi:hypothetical protein
MDESDKQKLDRVLKLSEENNEYIRKVRSSMRASLIFRVVYWAFLIMITLGGFYLVKPYISTITGLYSGLGNFGGGAGVPGVNLSDTKQLQELLKQLK